MISFTRRQNKSRWFFCKCSLINNFIMKLFPKMWHSQLDLCDYPCGKDIKGFALSENNGTLAKKKHFCFVLSWRHLFQNPKLPRNIMVFNNSNLYHISLKHWAQQGYPAYQGVSSKEFFFEPELEPSSKLDICLSPSPSLAQKSHFLLSPSQA